MNLYNMVFSKNSASKIILATLGLTEEDFKRFRDCWVEKHEDSYRIVVHTRLGGGNREHFSDNEVAGEFCTCGGCNITYRLHTHPLYLGDKDDDFDCTYADIYYKLPEDYKEELIAIASDIPIVAGDRWKALFESMQKDKCG